MTESLQTLNQRLKGATYLEDKIETIEILFDEVKKDPNGVGIHCLSAIIESMESFVHKLHFEILRNVFMSLNGREFVEMVVKNGRFIDILINTRNRRVIEMFNVICSYIDDSYLDEKFDEDIAHEYNSGSANMLSSVNDIAKVVSNDTENKEASDNMKDTSGYETTNIHKDTYAGKITKIFLDKNYRSVYFSLLDETNLLLLSNLSKSRRIKREIIDGGFLSKLVEQIKQRKTVKQSFNLIVDVIRDKRSGQDWILDNFQEVCDCFNISQFYFFNLMFAFLDEKNLRFVEYQEILTKNLLEKGLKMKRYDFVRKYFYGRKVKYIDESSEKDARKYFENKLENSRGMISVANRDFESKKENPNVPKQKTPQTTLLPIDYYNEFLVSTYKTDLLNLMFREKVHLPVKLDFDQQETIFYLTNLVYRIFIYNNGKDGLQNECFDSKNYNEEIDVNSLTPEDSEILDFAIEKYRTDLKLYRKLTENAKFGLLLLSFLIQEQIVDDKLVYHSDHGTIGMLYMVRSLCGNF